MSAWQEWKKSNAERQRQGLVSPLDFLNPNTEYIDEETAKVRMDACTECPRLTRTKQCTECGCFMPAKVRLKYATCPEDRWK